MSYRGDIIKEFQQGAEPTPTGSVASCPCEIWLFTPGAAGLVLPNTNTPRSGPGRIRFEQPSPESCSLSNYFLICIMRMALER
jgi:hypothetical protein